MKTFNSIKNGFAVLGFDSPESVRRDLLKINTISSMLIFGIQIIFISVFICCEASNFDEYVDGVYLLSSLTVCVFAYATMLWQIPRLYAFIIQLENIIGKSK